MGKLTGKYAVVTGAGKGIGRAIAERFLEDDVAGVALFDMDEPLVSATAKEMDPTGNRVIAVKCDVSNQENVNAAFAQVNEKFGRVDILVNNAGITRDAMFHKMTIEQAMMVMNVHFYGTFYCCQAVIGGMRERNYGKIVNISSVNALGNVGQANYTSAKCAIEGFTRTLAMESARKNITVNAIAPGMVDTDILKTIPADIMEQKIKATPAQRLADPSEIASVASFLASDDSSWVTGNCIMACGGQKMRG
ncbi:MAG: SDR family oxidoreductase [Oscillospiraceae bacterium]|nr:SDR family oxidoreductase [Oscillospiraceae bacterium]